MKIKSVIGECLVKMGKTDFSNKPNNTLTGEEGETIDKLLSSLNIAYREVISLYIPLIYTQEVNVANGILETSTLEKQILYPISLKYQGENVRFKTFPDKIECNINGVATLKYAYMPSKDFTIDDEITDMKLTQSILADGCLAGYYFSTKNFELARNFDTEFRVKLDLLKMKGRRLRIKSRGWQS